MSLVIPVKVEGNDQTITSNPTLLNDFHVYLDYYGYVSFYVGRVMVSDYFYVCFSKLCSQTCFYKCHSKHDVLLIINLYCYKKMFGPPPKP